MNWSWNGTLGRRILWERPVVLDCLSDWVCRNVWGFGRRQQHRGVVRGTPTVSLGEDDYGTAFGEANTLTHGASSLRGASVTVDR